MALPPRTCRPLLFSVSTLSFAPSKFYVRMFVFSPISSLLVISCNLFVCFEVRALFLCCRLVGGLTFSLLFFFERGGRGSGKIVTTLLFFVSDIFPRCL